MTVKDNGALIHGTPSQLYLTRNQSDGRSMATASTNMEPAGRQDDVLKLRATLNEKEMELIELRETHMQLVVSTRQYNFSFGSPVSRTLENRSH